MSEQSSGFSLGRLIAVLVPIVLIAFGIKQFASSGVTDAQEAMNADILARLLGERAGPKSPVAFVDKDGDLLTDAPADEECVTPEKLVFSYIGKTDQGDTASHWTDVVAALSEKLGVPIEYAEYKSPLAQMNAMAAGELHITAFNTGAVPLAVETAGYVPVCTFGRASEEGNEFGYTMQLITPAGSGVKTPGDLKGKKIAFVRPNSNSGCKAALVLLMDDYDLLPERDYDWRFLMKDHERSILGVASGDLQAAPVASDIFERMAANGEVDAEKIKVVYESERFPPAALGFAYNLKPEMRDAIKEVLLGFEWAGSSIEGKYGGADAEKFVPVNFKDDWANIRRIDDAVKKARQAKAAK